MQGIPDVDDARAWCGVSSTAVPDEDLEAIRVAELTIQARLLEIPPDPDTDGNEATYPEPLARALLRRIQRECAAKNAPLGLIGGEANEWSPVGLQSWDAEVQRLEASYLLPVIA